MRKMEQRDTNSALLINITTKHTRWNKWALDANREIFEMFKTTDTNALEQDKNCQTTMI
jgi:hypothetical protein